MRLRIRFACLGLVIAGVSFIFLILNIDAVASAEHADTHCHADHLIVTRSDDREAKKPDELGLTLREALKCKAGRPLKIRFDPSIRHIKLKRPLRISGGIDLSGKDFYPLIVWEGAGSLLYLTNADDTRIANLSFTQKTGASDLSGDCITIRDGGVRIVLEAIRVSRCNDGLVDITAKAGAPRMDVTIREVLFADHDKAMLISAPPLETDICNQPPAIQVTLDKVIFQRTGQRHPRAAGNVYVRVQDSKVHFAPYQRPDGSFGASYGVAASLGARIDVKDTHFYGKDTKGRHMPVKTLRDDHHPCTEVSLN